MARLLLSTRFGRDTGPDVATDAAKAGLRKPGATSLRLAKSRGTDVWQASTDIRRSDRLTLSDGATSFL